MPQYRSAGERLDAAGDRLYEQGTRAKTHDDRYILATVFFAAVLGMAVAMLIGGGVFVLTLPVA